MASRKLIPVAALSISVGLFISVVRCPLSEHSGESCRFFISLLKSRLYEVL